MLRMLIALGVTVSIVAAGAPPGVAADPADGVVCRATTDEAGVARTETLWFPRSGSFGEAGGATTATFVGRDASGGTTSGTLQINGDGTKGLTYTRTRPGSLPAETKSAFFTLGAVQFPAQGFTGSGAAYFFAPGGLSHGPVSMTIDVGSCAFRPGPW